MVINNESIKTNWVPYGDPSLPSDNVLDFMDTRRNMYGCSPCKCGALTRAAFKRKGITYIICDDCGLSEVAGIINYE